MRINHNLMAMNTHRMLGVNNAKTSKSVEKLSSGLRINRAGDDAAGLAISEKMRNQIKGLKQASRNSQDGISLIQTAEGALNETHSMLKRMRELAVQSNNDTNTSDDLTQIQEEIDALVSEVDRISSKTTFNTKNLLDGSLGATIDTGATDYANYESVGIDIEINGITSGTVISVTSDTAGVTVDVNGVAQTITFAAGSDNATVAANTVLNFDAVGVKLEFNSTADISTAANFNELTVTGTQASFQIGANENTTLDISIADMSASALGTDGAWLTNGVQDVNVSTQTFSDNIQVIDEAIEDVSTQRSKLGAWQNRLEHTIKNLDTSSENLQAAESRIRDVDMAAEMMDFTKNNILQQAAQSMLAQANQQPQGVLQLLR